MMMRNNMIKVCYIITKLELGGAQKVALHIAKNIDKSIFDSFIIAGEGGILDHEAVKKVRLYHIKDLVREVSPLKDLKALFKIYSILKKEKPNIVHTHSSKAGIAGRIAAKLAGVKVIVHTIHGYGFNETQKWFIKKFYVFLEKFCALLSDKLVVVTKEDIKKGQHYKIAKEKKFVLIRAGINTALYKNFIPNPNFKETLGINKNLRVITTIGPFKPQKNLKDFIKTASLITSRLKNVVFLMVGDGEQRKELEGLRDSLNLKNKVFMLGWRTDIAEILKVSDIFVLTSLWEGLPCTIVEAMCCSKPVVANAVDGVKEIVVKGETGFLIEPNNYAKTAEKIMYLLNDETALKNMSAKACASIGQEYDIHHNLKQHEKLYLQLS
ncbi:MAG: glycosyltransferase family 4 protein [Endomicrobium sp.]|jgi:glycosyltransferase involved in cell wall biosynthesis|nr:glycosyltransferase family 4 protein [Endomicrobium sp.]